MVQVLPTFWILLFIEVCIDSLRNGSDFENTSRSFRFRAEKYSSTCIDWSSIIICLIYLLYYLQLEKVFNQESILLGQEIIRNKMGNSIIDKDLQRHKKQLLERSKLFEEQILRQKTELFDSNNCDFHKIYLQVYEEKQEAQFFKDLARTYKEICIFNSRSFDKQLLDDVCIFITLVGRCLSETMQTERFFGIQRKQQKQKKLFRTDVLVVARNVYVYERKQRKVKTLLAITLVLSKFMLISLDKNELLLAQGLKSTKMNDSFIKSPTEELRNITHNVI